MKKVLLSLFSLIIFYQAAQAQSPSLQQKLYYTCKIWGFVKYYHSNVSNCGVNWDSVLIHTLPLVKNATTSDGFNDALDTMLLAAGPMDIANTPLPDTIPTTLKRNRNWGWTNDLLLRTDVQVILDTIKNNFRPHPMCWVEVNPNIANGGYLTFPPDLPLLDVNTYSNYPDEFHRLLLMFKHWNIINYFNPYNYVLDKPTDTLLNNNVLYFDTVTTPYHLFVGIKRLTAGLNDEHVDEFTTSAANNNLFVPKLRLRYVENKYVVVKSGIDAIPVGSTFLSANGLTTTQWEDSMGHYVSAGNSAVFRKMLCDYYLLKGVDATHVDVIYADPTGNIHDTSLIRTTNYLDPFFPQYYYPTDSLYHINWTSMNCGIGYINNTNLSVAAADSAYDALQNAPAIIIDCRNHPHADGSVELMNRMLAGPLVAARYTAPDVTYPGTFSLVYNDAVGITNNLTPYTGQVIVLLNEQTISAGESDAMVFSEMPNAIKIGSQTAGADGVITYFQMTQDIQTGYTSLGWYYPNGDSTQRIGLVPDLIVNPTIAAIMQGRDEVLEAALYSAGCNLQVANMPSALTDIKVYPNPASDVVNVTANGVIDGSVNVTLTDICGKELQRNNVMVNDSILFGQLNIESLPPGIYLISIVANGERKTMKVVKE